MDWFYQPHQEDHLTVSLWENFALFEPRQVLGAVFSAAGIPIPRPIQDCCWSYQFESVSRELCDVVVQMRDLEGDSILVVESKKPKNIMKRGTKDTNPDYYLGIGAFRSFPQKYLIYLVDKYDLVRQRESIGHAAPHVGFLTWQQLAGIQMNLVDSIEAPIAIRSFLRHSLGWQFESRWSMLGRSFSAQSGVRTAEDIAALCRDCLNSLALDTSSMPLSSELFSRLLKNSETLPVSDRIRNFVRGMLQHQAWWHEATPAPFAHPYLQNEPGRADINASGPAKQRMRDRQIELWRL